MICDALPKEHLEANLKLFSEKRGKHQKECRCAMCKLLEGAIANTKKNLEKFKNENSRN